MIKKLTKHGNSHALVIDKPILDLLGISPKTPLSVTTDGNCLVIARAQDEKKEKAFREALETGHRKFAGMFRRLAQ